MSKFWTYHLSPLLWLLQALELPGSGELTDKPLHVFYPYYFIFEHKKLCFSTSNKCVTSLQCNFLMYSLINSGNSGEIGFSTKSCLLGCIMFLKIIICQPTTILINFTDYNEHLIKCLTIFFLLSCLLEFMVCRIFLGLGIACCWTRCT